MSEKRSRDAALLNAMHPGTVLDEVPLSDGPIHFDGGVRGDFTSRIGEPTRRPQIDRVR